jgi:hypothetical protein
MASESPWATLEVETHYDLWHAQQALMTQADWLKAFSHVHNIWAPHSFPSFTSDYLQRNQWCVTPL